MTPSARHSHPTERSDLIRARQAMSRSSGHFMNMQGNEKSNEKAGSKTKHEWHEHVTLDVFVRQSLNTLRPTASEQASSEPSIELTSDPTVDRLLSNHQPIWGLRPAVERSTQTSTQLDMIVLKNADENGENISYDPNANSRLKNKQLGRGTRMARSSRPFSLDRTVIRQRLAAIPDRHPTDRRAQKL